MKYFFLLCSLLPFLLSCGKEEGGGASKNPYENSKAYFTSVRTIQVQVAYEPNAEPYSGSISALTYWDIVEENIVSLFANRSPLPAVVVPKKLVDMDAIPEQNRNEWKSEDILALANKYRKGKSTQDKAHFFVVFLTGHFEGKDTVVGVHIEDTTVLAIFKDVVKSTQLNGPLLPHYVELSTVVHEMGHALGLVNAGLPLTSNHHDKEHGHHCTNPDCVMYWQNEGIHDLVGFAQRILGGGTTLLYGSECLQDARQYNP